MPDYFSDSYAQARNRFLQFAQVAHANLDSYQISASGPEGIALTTDFAWIGTEVPKKMLLVQSGVHGVEAFAGAAIQCELLQNLPIVAKDTALVLVHVLNPFGMAWLRRANESNVDLNRNCLTGEQSYAGAAENYSALNSLINPTSPPRNDLFLLRVLAKILSHGMKPLKQAIAQGQYEYPKGLFYGGAQLEQGPNLFRQWIANHVSTIDSVMIIDLHTGLGRFGEHQVFLSSPVDRYTLKELKGVLSDALVTDEAKSDGYKITGGIASLYGQVVGSLQPIYLTVEFGTYSPLKMLHTLRDENRSHFYVKGGQQQRWRERLKQAFCPESMVWRARVVEQGCLLVERLLKHVAVSI